MSDNSSKEIRSIVEDDGTIIKIIAGNYRGYIGPVDGIAAEPEYLDVYIPPLKYKKFPFDTRRQGFAYIFEGNGNFHNASNPIGVKVEKEFEGQEIELRDLTGNRTLVVFDNGDEVTVQAGENGIRFLLISGTPIKEPVAWHGPIVMNTHEELQEAFSQLNNGNLIEIFKSDSSPLAIFTENSIC